MEQWQQALRQGHLSGVYLLHGTEENLKLEALQRARRLVLADGMAELNETVLTNPSGDELIAACETIPFMAEQRLVIVRDADGLGSRKDAAPGVVEYMERVPPGCVLIFYHSGKADGKRRLPDAIRKYGLAVDFEPLSDQAVACWVQERFQALGKECSGRVADVLVFTAGRDTAVLQGEVAKLCAFIGDHPAVEASDVAAIATKTTEYNIFRLVDAVAANDEKKAMQLFRNLLVNGEDELMVLAMLLRLYRQMQQVLILELEHVPPQAWPEKTGLSSYALDQVRRQARQVRPTEVKRVIRLCLDTEYAVKSGRRSQLGCAEAVLLHIFALRAGGGMA